MNGRLVGSLTFEEIARLSERSVLLLPIGSMEQHGPHRRSIRMPSTRPGGGDHRALR